MTIVTRAHLRVPFSALCLLLASSFLPWPATAEEVVNVYSYREPGLIEPHAQGLHRQDRHRA